MSSGGARWVLRFYVVVALLFVFAPAISLTVISFQEAKVQSFPIKDYTWRWYEDALTNEDIKEGLRNSLMVGTMVAVLSTFLGFTSAHVLSRERINKKALYAGLVSLPVLVPAILSGLGMMIYFQHINIAGTIWAVVIAHTCFASPFALAILLNPYQRLNIELEQAARDLGANRLRVVTRIVLPQLWPAIVSAGLLSFLLSWDEFILAWFVSGFNKTLPVVIYGMMGSSFNPSLNAVGVMSMAVSVILLLMVFVFRNLGVSRGSVSKPEWERT